MSECDSSNHPVSTVAVVVVVVVVVDVNFFGFSTFSLKLLHDPTKFVNIGVLPIFFMELQVILCNFWPILKKSIKPLTRNHSYLVWRVPRGSSLFKLGHCDLYL